MATSSRTRLGIPVRVHHHPRLSQPAEYDALPSITTSTPGRTAKVSFAAPDPMPTPVGASSATMLSMVREEDEKEVEEGSEGDELHQEQEEGITVFGEEDDGVTMLMGVNFQPAGQASALTQHNHTDIWDDTVELERRAFSDVNPFLGGHLGEKMFQLLVAPVDPLDALDRLDTGNTTLRRSSTNFNNGSSSMVMTTTTTPDLVDTSVRSRHSPRKNERTFVGAGGTSFIEYEQEVRFGDDLLLQEREDTSHPALPTQPSEVEYASAMPLNTSNRSLLQGLVLQVPQNAPFSGVFRSPSEVTARFVGKVIVLNHADSSSVPTESSIALPRSEDEQEMAAPPGDPADDVVDTLDPGTRSPQESPHPSSTRTASPAAITPRSGQQSQDPHKPLTTSAAHLSTASGLPGSASSERDAARIESLQPILRRSPRKAAAAQRQSTGGISTVRPASLFDPLPSRKARRPSAPLPSRARRPSTLSSSVPPAAKPPAWANETRLPVDSITSHMLKDGEGTLPHNAPLADIASVHDVAPMDSRALPTEEMVTEEANSSAEPGHSVQVAEALPACEADTANTSTSAEALKIPLPPSDPASSIFTAPSPPYKLQPVPPLPLDTDLQLSSPMKERSRRRIRRHPSALRSRIAVAPPHEILSPVVEDKERSQSQSFIQDQGDTAQAVQTDTSSRVPETEDSAREATDDVQHVELDHHVAEILQASSIRGHHANDEDALLESGHHAKEDAAPSTSHDREQTPTQHESALSPLKRANDDTETAAHVDAVKSPGPTASNSFITNTHVSPQEISRHTLASATIEADGSHAHAVLSGEAGNVSHQSLAATVSDIASRVLSRPRRHTDAAKVDSALQGPSQTESGAQLQPTLQRKSHPADARLTAKSQAHPTSKTVIRPHPPTAVQPVARAAAIRHRAVSQQSGEQAVHSRRQPPEASVPTNKEQRGRKRTVSVPVNFSPKGQRVKRVQRQPSNDDMFSRKQRDLSKGRGLDLAPLSQGSTNGDPSGDDHAPEPERPEAKSRNRQTAINHLTAPRAFTFAGDTQSSKRKRDEVEPPKSSVALAPRRPATRAVPIARRKREAAKTRSAAVAMEPSTVELAPLSTNEIARRCLQDIEAQEDETVESLTEEALSRLNRSLQDKADQSVHHDRSTAAVDHEQTVRTENLQRYLKELDELHQSNQEERL